MDAIGSAPATSVERFWCPRGGTYALDGDGFLRDPDTRWIGSESANPGVVRTTQLVERRCLVLLGEPGAGKSSTLANADRLVDAQMPVVSFDLAGYGSEERLVREVFSHQSVANWSAGSGELCLVLDSLDEARARIPHVGTLLADCISRLPAGRLFLRIVCRTADWPAGLEERLNEMFDSVTLVEILPLRRIDVLAIAADWCDSSRLLDEVVRAGAGPLAARPLTLRLLARSFDRSGTLPDRGAALYAAGVRALCEEQSTARLDAGLRGGLLLDQRIAVARRIAAATVFCGASALWTGPEIDVSVEDVALGHLAHGAEPTPSGNFNVSIHALLEAAGTGLFTSRGGRRLGWAHATFADFLAAEWVVMNGLSISQVRPLFLGPDGRCWPQTRLAATWCVAIAPDRFDFLVIADPEAFQGEVELSGDGLRASVIDGLFSIASTLAVSRWDRSYDSLRHPNIAIQLRPHLRDKDADRRRLALELADECAAVELLDELAAISLDRSAETQDRVAAGWALAHLSDPHRTAALRPIALCPLAENDDPMDEIKGVALNASWPNAISNTEVFSVLTPRRQKHFHGAYAMFLSRFREAIGEADIEDGLDWLLEDCEAPVGDHILAALANRVLTLAASSPVHPRIVDAFTRLVIARVKHYEGFLFEDFGRGERVDLFADEELRRAIAWSVLRSHPDDEVAYRLSSSSTYSQGVIRGEDLPWLAEKCAEADSSMLDSVRLLFRLTLDFDRREHCDLLLAMSPAHPLYDEIARPWVEPIALDSPEASARRQSWEMSRQPKTAASDNLNEEIDKLLDRFFAGESVGFWYAIRLLAVSPGAKRFGAEFDPDVVGMDRWPTLSERTKKRLLEAADSYLRSHRCQGEKWLGRPNLAFYPAMAGYRAMLILLRLAPERLSGFPDSVWTEWAPVLAATSTAAVNGATWEDKLRLFDFAGDGSLDATRVALLAHVDGAVSAGERPCAKNEADYLWDESVANGYMRLVRTAEIGPSEEILNSLVRHDSKPLRGLLTLWLDDLAEIDRRRLAATTIIDHDLEWGWPRLQVALGSDLEFALQVLSQSMVVRGFERFDHVLPEVLADIYIWLRGKFPPETDPQYDDVHMVGAREQVGQWRDNLISALQEIGSSESVRALRLIAEALPDDRWLGRTIAIAEANLRRNQWTPTCLADLLRIGNVRDAVVVNNSADLWAAVSNALDEIGGRLVGATPESHYLWDSHAGRPKSEDEVSDYLSNELNRILVSRGAIVNREVQVRRNRPSGIGERTDLLVEAVSLGSVNAGRLSLPIEVKGAWNADVLSALQNQLVDRYMRDIAADVGVFVVVWPDLNSWTDMTDQRRRVLESVDRQAVERYLAAEASKVKLEGVSVNVVHLGIEYRRPA